MLQKHEILREIHNGYLVAVIRGKSKEEAVEISKQAFQGGIRSLEITFSTPGAEDAIAELVQTGDPNMVVGAGTVLDAETARIAMSRRNIEFDQQESAILEQVFEETKKSFSEVEFVGKREYFCLYTPLLNEQNENIGLYFIGLETVLRDMVVETTIKNIFIIAIVALVLIIFIINMFVLRSLLNKPLKSLIKAVEKFDYTKVVKIINGVLKEFKAPYVIKPEKTRFAAKAGPNWNLGVMLNKDNNITVGHRKKKYFKAALCNFVCDQKNGIQWLIDDVLELHGTLAYYESVEPDYFNYLIRHYNQKFKVDCIDLLKNAMSGVG